jgi:CubicO group peptidase (beta-lactamase class C family)
VAHGTAVHIEAVGTLAFDSDVRMGGDSVFRIASLTKPVVAAAVMMLIEDGVLSLDASVEDFLPELANRRVLRRIEGELDDNVAARRPITVDDLLTFRLGFGFGMELMAEGEFPIQAAVAELGLRTLGPPWPPSPHTPDEWIRRFGTLPLMYQPGERWLYDTGAKVYGVLIERAGGMPLAAFLEERIFEPLGMGDTGFWFRPDQRGRTTTAYNADLSVLDASDASSYWSEPPAMPDASGWLVSTIADFWAFVDMLASGGGALLSQATVAAMTTNHITAAQRGLAAPFLDAGHGWGYGMAASVPGDVEARVPVGFGWEGGTGTTWRTDPATGLTGILFTQRSMESPVAPELYDDFWASARSALSD